MREILILITIISALIAGSAIVDNSANTTNTTTNSLVEDDIEKPHIKIPGS